MGNSMNNYSKKTLVLVLFFFVLAVSLLFFDAVKKDNTIEAAVCSNLVDAILVVDRSGSMDELDENGEKRIEVAKSAALSFIDNLDSSVDRVGLEIFANNAELSSGLTSIFGDVNDEINSLEVEEGGQTNTEAAIIQARGELNNNGRDYAARVMIILSDGIPNRSYNTGDAVELAITAADTAKANGIRIISIGLDIAVDSDAEIFMKEIASAPGDYYSSSGTYECGLDENGDPFNYLVCIYKQISESICDSTPPVITNISKKQPAGTLYSGDNLIIKSEISDDFGIKEHEIKWSADNWATENIEQCTVFSGFTNICEKNIGTFDEEKVILYKSYVVDTNDNTTEGTENGNDYKSVEVASVTLEINGDINGKLSRNQTNAIKIKISDPQGKADDDSFYVSVDSIDKGEEIEFNKKLMSNCNGDGSNWSCSNSEFNPDCSWTDAGIDVYVYPHSDDIGYHNYAIKKVVDLVNPEENLIVGNCSDGVDNDCNGKTDLESGIEEQDCDSIAPTVAISRKLSETETVLTSVYNNNSVTLSSVAGDLPEGLNGLMQHTIYWFKNGVEQTSESCGSAANCEKIIGIFSAGTEIEYYAKATDSSIVPNSSCDPSGCSTRYSFIVKDFECDGQLDLTGCSGGSGACCNNICDITQDSNLYDSECSTTGCNGNDWGWVADNETGDCSDGTNSDGCYAVGAGCEERNYSCSSGSCASVAYDGFNDVCVGLILNDYGCNGLECELLSSINDPSCDNQLEDISILAKDSDGNIILSGGDVLDSKTDKVTLISSSSDTYSIAQHKIFWTSNGWTSTNEIDCGSLEECSGQIGPFGISITVQYYSRAVDGNGEIGETAHYSSFTVVDSSCYGVSDMTSCEKNGNSGRCCGGVCDTSFDSSTLYDTECMTEGCNLESWGYVPIEDGESCNATGENACFSYFSGCEKRDYSCATGLCLYTSANSNTDICSGNIFMDYGCSGADCSFVNDDCSDCSCSCGSYNLDEKIYSSLSFDGVNDYISLSGLGVSTSTDSRVSVEFWMKWNGGNSQMPFGWTSYDLWFASGSFGFNTGAGDIWGISSFGLSSGLAHVVAIFNNGDAKLS
ncbi:VWA domain-containing protein, partial [Patescibacteria group bacterium]|nr:VWA domain-containing protein [Patescibacteria group bacterium]